MKLKPLADRILVSVNEVNDEKTAGGLYIPGTVDQKGKTLYGRVVAVGPGKMDKDGNRQTSEIKKGDQVLFTAYCGTPIVDAGKKYLILKEDEILGIAQ